MSGKKGVYFSHADADRHAARIPKRWLQRLGLLINFGERLIKDGIVRLVHGFPEGQGPRAKPPSRKEAGP